MTSTDLALGLLWVIDHCTRSATDVAGMHVTHRLFSWGTWLANSCTCGNRAAGGEWQRGYIGSCHELFELHSQGGRVSMIWGRKCVQSIEARVDCGIARGRLGQTDSCHRCHVVARHFIPFMGHRTRTLWNPSALSTSFCRPKVLLFLFGLSTRLFGTIAALNASVSRAETWAPKQKMYRRGFKGPLMKSSRSPVI